MGVAEALTPRNPLNAKLDGKSFVQLTIWVMVVAFAWMLGNWLIKQGQAKAAQLTGKTSNTGSSNPFFG